jgi:hypothetical protein
MTPRISVLSLMIVGVLAAADQKPAAKKEAPLKAKPAQQITIPEGAIEVEPYTYRYTDRQGKKWLYRKTPFGVMRWEDKPDSPEAVQRSQDEKARLVDNTTAAEDGDSIRFERATPFGPMKWQRKKTELNDVERAVWDRELKKRQAPQSANKE